MFFFNCPFRSICEFTAICSQDFELLCQVCIGTHASVERLHWLVQVANRWGGGGVIF